MNGGETKRSTFRRSLNGATAAELWLDGVAAAGGLPESLVFAMRVCLEELFCNIVRHGDPHNDGTVQIAISFGLDRVHLTVEDDGPEFDVSLAEAHPITQPLEDIEPGGLGILLVRSFSNRLEYRRIEGRNHVTVEFAL
jgi:serine/threonine-protein kinase RsbW